MMNTNEADIFGDNKGQTSTDRNTISDDGIPRKVPGLVRRFNIAATSVINNAKAKVFRNRKETTSTTSTSKTAKATDIFDNNNGPPVESTEFHLPSSASSKLKTPPYDELPCIVSENIKGFDDWTATESVELADIVTCQSKIRSAISCPVERDGKCKVYNARQNVYEILEFHGKEVSIVRDAGKKKHKNTDSSLEALDLTSMTSLVDRALTTIDKLEMREARCISSKNGENPETYQARHEEWGPVVYKQLMVSFLPDKVRDSLVKEAKVHIQLIHPSIERFVGMVLNTEQCGLVMEYLKYGNIQKFTSDFEVDWGWKLQMSFDIVLGMNYLHAQTPIIVHGRLSAQNVLIGQGFKAKISNFGFHNFQRLSTSILGLESQHPPNVGASAVSIKGLKDDLFQFGLLLREIFTLGRSDQDLSDTFEKLCSQHQESIAKAKRSLNRQEEEFRLDTATRCAVGIERTPPKEAKGDVSNVGAGHRTRIPSEPNECSERHTAVPVKPSTTDVQAEAFSELTNAEIRERVVKNYVSVLRNADGDVESIADFLWQEGIVREEPLQIIQNKLANTSKRDSCRFLLDKLLSSGNPEAFVALLKALEKYIPYLATAIKNTEPTDYPDESTKNVYIGAAGVAKYDFEAEQDGVISFDKGELITDIEDSGDGWWMGTCRNERGWIPSNYVELRPGISKDLNRQTKYRVVDHYRDLVHNINPEDVLDLLFQEGIITLEEKLTLLLENSSKTQQKKCRALMDNLLYAQNERTFVVFRQALNENGYKWLVKKLDEHTV